MNRYLKTNTILDKILDHKQGEIAAAKLQRSRSELEAALPASPPVLDFAAALRKDTVALIAEVKKASPSKGVLIAAFDHMALAQTYAQNGASAISVLTDEAFFQGNLRYLREISQAVNIPTLRKDFVMDPYQILEAREAGASAVLLIVAALEDQHLADLHQVVTSYGMTALVEVHDEIELERALKIGATVIGVNNRDLKTFHVDLDTTARIARLVPEIVTLVAESGLKTAGDVLHMGQLGAHAVLIGEGIVISPEHAVTVRELSQQLRRPKHEG